MSSVKGCGWCCGTGYLQVNCNHRRERYTKSPIIALDRRPDMLSRPGIELVGGDVDFGVLKMWWVVNHV